MFIAISNKCDFINMLEPVRGIWQHAFATRQSERVFVTFQKYLQELFFLKNLQHIFET